MNAAKQRLAKPGKKPVKRKHILTTDREGGIPLPKGLVRKMGLKIGDEFAAWKEGEKILLVFPKRYRGKRKIPKDAHYGKIEPALPEESVAAPKPGTLEHQAACKALMAIGPVKFKPRKPRERKSRKRSEPSTRKK